MANVVVRISGLTKFDVREIGEKPGISFTPIAIPDGSHGEATVFLAIFGMSALTTLAAYLLRKHDNQSFEENVEIIHPDGSVEKRQIKYRREKAEAPAAAILKQIRGPI